MNLIDKVVTHKTFGTGAVVSVGVSGTGTKKVITVVFPAPYGIKRFLADTFVSYLRFEDPTAQSEYERLVAEKTERERAEAERLAEEKKARELALAEAEKEAREAKIAEVMQRIGREMAARAAKETALAEYGADRPMVNASKEKLRAA